MTVVNRRTFLAGALAAVPAAAALSAQRAAAKASPAPALPPLCVFSKHLQFLDWPALAKTCKKLGLDGVDLTVRPGGHVLPERVAVDLPAAVDAIRSEGLDVFMITTRFLSGADAQLRDVFQAAKACGIPYCRIGNHRYDARGPIMPQLDAIVEELRPLVRLAEECGITAGYHNHSGKLNVGAPLWDLHYLYAAVGSERLGSNFDVGHAVVEGAYGDWEITARLLAPWVRVVAVKDFVFDGAEPRWTPLGQGVVDVAAFLKIFRDEAGFAGPVSLHFEYKTPSQDATIEEIGKAVRHMREEVYPKIA